MTEFRKIITFSALILCSTYSFSAQKNEKQSSPDNIPPTILEERKQEEQKVLFNEFAIALYKQNYILPFYFTGSPYNQVYVNNTPDNEKLKHPEVKYQLSFKIPLWRNMVSTPTTLYFGYTQLSYWQLYNKSAFFRSTDYEPEFFTQTDLHVPLVGNWRLNVFRLGAVHQSNGYGNELERTWNRVYAEASMANEHALVAIRPWIIFHNDSYRRYNPDMAKYMGHTEISLAYKFENQHVASLRVRNLGEHGSRYVTNVLTYSFPITKYIRGYGQIFSGYGQSLLEYNHRTNSIGLGFALNDFV